MKTQQSCKLSLASSVFKLFQFNFIEKSELVKKVTTMIMSKYFLFSILFRLVESISLISVVVGTGSSITVDHAGVSRS